MKLLVWELEGNEMICSVFKTFLYYMLKFVNFRLYYGNLEQAPFSPKRRHLDAFNDEPEYCMERRGQTQKLIILDIIIHVSRCANSVQAIFSPITDTC